MTLNRAGLALSYITFAAGFTLLVGALTNPAWLAASTPLPGTICTAPATPDEAQQAAPASVRTQP